MPLERLVYQLTVRTTIEVFAVGAVGLGALIAVGGPARFATPSLATARLVPGGCYTWAALIAGAGILTLGGIKLGWRPHVVMAGIAAQGGWFAFFDLSLWITAANDPTTPLTGCGVYLMVAVACGILYGGGHGLVAAQHAQEEDPQQ